MQFTPEEQVTMLQRALSETQQEVTALRTQTSILNSQLVILNQKLQEATAETEESED